MSRRYKYTCPDVVHYRRNQYRLAIWSNVIQLGIVGAFFGVLTYFGKQEKNFNEFAESTQTES